MSELAGTKTKIFKGELVEVCFFICSGYSGKLWEDDLKYTHATLFVRCLGLELFTRDGIMFMFENTLMTQENVHSYF